MIGQFLRKIIYSNLYFFRKKKYTCNSCKTRLHSYLRLADYYLKNLDEHGYVHSVFAGETLNLFQYNCPVCYCTDRDRLYILYLENYLKTIDRKAEFQFLDIAPAPALSDWLRKNHSWINYRTVDLYMKNVDDKADITDLEIYQNEKFDFILCSHVLEHIENDKRAISELYRILKSNGRAIIMVPILLTLENDFENPDYKTESERWKYFGQDDHVRLYSKNGFVKKLEDAGFKVSQMGIDYFGPESFSKHGIHKRSVLYVVNK